jgi:Putative prokaryotic signal transducing protein
MSVRVVTGVHEIEAEAAATRLRSAGINAQIIRDNEALLGVTGSASIGTFSVAIADSDREEAERALKIRKSAVRSAATSDGPFSATAILIIVLALAALLVGLYAWSAIVR